MATYFYGVNVGAGISGGAVTESATTTSKDVEIAINTTANVPSRHQLLVCIDALYAYIAAMTTKNF